VNQPGTWRKAVAHSVSFGCFVDPTPLILRYRVWRGAAASGAAPRVADKEGCAEGAGEP
jgi:hypothetical protein